MKKLYIILTCALTSASSHVMSMEQSIIPTQFTQEQINLTKKLYEPLNPKILKELHQKGAIINGKIIPKSDNNNDYDEPPLSCWVTSFNTIYKQTSNTSQNEKNFKEYLEERLNGHLEIITTFLELGANPTKEFNGYYSDLLMHSLRNQNEKSELLLKFKPKQLHSYHVCDIWDRVLGDYAGVLDQEKNHPYIGLLCTYFTPDELNLGVKRCMVQSINKDHEDTQLRSNFIKTLIKYGANPNTLLENFLLPLSTTTLEFIKLFCDNGAFNEAILKTLENHRKKLEYEQKLCASVIDILKKNESV